MKNEILDLEKKYWNGMESHDFETVKNLTHFPCMVVGPDGAKCVDETSFKKMFEIGKDVKMKILGISNSAAEVISDSCVVLAYHVEIESSMGGKEQKSLCACASTWVKEEQGWRCALHSETEISTKD